MDRPYSAAELRAAMARMTLREQEQLSTLVETALARTEVAPQRLSQIGLTRCAHCGRALTQPATGRPRRFCTVGCRVNAALRRNLGVSEDARYQLDGRR